MNKGEGVGLSVYGVTYAIADNTILHDIEFTVPPGARVAIIGPNGSGKSTLLRIIAGFYKLQSGSILIGDTPVACLKGRKRAALVCYLPQHSDFVFPLSVAEYLFAAIPSRMAPTDRQNVLEQSLAATKTTPLLVRDIRTLSGGERQRVLVAGAIIQRAKLLLVDEPTAHLDPSQQKEVDQLLGDVWKKYQCTVVKVTHSLHGISNSCDFILGLKSGRVAFFGRLDHLNFNDLVSELYVN